MSVNDQHVQGIRSDGPHLAVGDRQWLHFTETSSGWPEHDGPGYFAACGAGAFGMLDVTQDVTAVRCPDCHGRRP